MNSISSAMRKEFVYSETFFWESVNILLAKPHVVNKRLWGSKILLKCNCKPLKLNWNVPLNCERLKNMNPHNYKSTVLKELEVEECSDSNTSRIQIILSELLPKSYCDNHAFQVAILMKEDTTIAFYDITPNNLVQNLCPGFSYAFQLSNNEIAIKANCEKDSKQLKWLTDVVLPHIVKWGAECRNSPKTNICTESLALVCNDKYYNKYNDLKVKYGKDMVKIWPECTDPAKFVYEDIAIATYLLVLWEDEKYNSHSSRKKTFVDLGCGNGLLVYILTKEGHEGVGIDVRKRHIWDMYPKDIKLEEKTIIPSDIHLFPDKDWIIGNHSDELTPWIPVIAARSSYKCNFFLLPCCAFNFDGSKYQRHNSSKSQYIEYLEYIRKLCEDSGFNVDTDRLKIPSTKRICLIGKGRTYSATEQDEYIKKIQEIVNVETNEQIRYTFAGSSWIKDFKPRDPIERVRNCTKIEKNIIEYIVEVISNYLLEGCSLEVKWSPGKTANLSEIVPLIPNNMLKALKSECGGLQTLLKNNHHIFKVQSGTVQLRYPRTVLDVQNELRNNKKSSVKIKQKLCWFYGNHPHGCPLSDNLCSFLHVKN